jgi:hypothetical protein
MSRETENEFVRAYHLTTHEHAISNISLRRLKVARLSEVNDPFELLALDCMDKRRRRALAEFKQLHDKTTGMLSFSRRWKNPVLWSHYANGGRGIALGFDIKKTFGVRGVCEVLYQDRKLMALGDTPDPISKEFQDLLFVTKFSHWAYEEELRVFVHLAKMANREDSRYFLPFSADLALKEVVLGPFCPLSLDSVGALLHSTNSGATVARARLGFKYFEVKEDGSYRAQ